MYVGLLLALNLFRVASCTRELRLLGILSETGVGYRSAGACFTASQMALEHVNNNTSILKDYHLTYTWIDSKCDPGTSLYRMFKRLYNDPPYLMLLGGACSVVSETAAQVSHLWNLTQLSYESSSPVLSDRTRFPRFFRLYMPDQKLNIARIGLMRQFNWEKVATINQAREFFSTVIEDFVRRIDGTNITILSQEIFTNNPNSRVQNLKNHDARIIIMAMYEDMAREVLCAAFKVGLLGPRIVWMFVGWYSLTFWKENLEKVDCTEYQMTLVVEGSFFTGAAVKNPVEEEGIANITADEFDSLYHRHPTYNLKWRFADFVAPLCYDHIWVAAMALECARQKLQEKGHEKPLNEFTYADGDMNDLIFDCMGNISLTGISGRLAFTEGSDPERLVIIERIQDGHREEIGLYMQDKHTRHFKWIDGAIRWKDGIIPRDSSYIIYKENIVPESVSVVMTSLAVLGICLALSFLSTNVIYRNNRSVKLSSPNINNMLLLGCVLCYCSVFFNTSETENAALCKARTYTFSIGFTITFGALFSKTWRVYRIFTNQRLAKMKIKDGQLFAVNALLVALILALLLAWETVGPLTIKIKLLPKEVYVTADETMVYPFVRICWSAYSTYFCWAIYIMQGALLAFGAFLAWETRHVHLEALNDSQKIGMCLYNVVILSAVGLTLKLVLEDQEVLLYGITSGFLIFGTTVTQLIIFIPKICAIYNKVEDGNISTIAQKRSTASTTDMPSQHQPPSSQMVVSSQHQPPSSQMVVSSQHQPPSSQMVLSTQHQPPSSQMVVSSQHQPPSSQMALSTQDQPSSSRMALSTQDQPSSSQMALSSQYQPSSSKMALSTQYQPSSSKMAVSSQDQPSSSQMAVSTQDQPSSSKKAVSTQDQPSSSQMALSTQDQPSSSRMALSTKDQPSSSQMAVSTQDQPSSSQMAVSTQDQPSSSQIAVSTQDQPSLSPKTMCTQHQLS